MYLAEKHNILMPLDITKRYIVIQWLMFQMGGVGPMLGQAHHFRHYAPEKIPYAVDRYTKEAARHYGVINKRLGETPYLAGEAYSIADIATFPWIRSYKRQGQELDDFPNVKRWFEEINSRPTVQRGIEALKDLHLEVNDQARECLFGSTQYRSHSPPSI